MDEKTFYKDWYSKKHIVSRADALSDLWYDRVHPERREVLKRMGHLEGKDILCLGNGTREKEIFLSNCRRLIISDIVPESVLKVKAMYDTPENVIFSAIDAYNIPLNDNSLDIVYGWQMTHHLEKMDEFFDEVKRVLKPGGMAIFVDNVYSPAWHFIKWKMLKPLTGVFLRKRGVSDRDLEFSKGGDYDPEILSDMLKKKGLSDPEFSRFNLMSYIFLKSMRDMFSLQVTSKVPVLYQIAWVLSASDRWLGRIFPGYGRNLRNMVWSFKK